MRVALVHDWLTGMRGGERVLDELARMFPDADLYTLVHLPGRTSAAIEARRIIASPLSRLPGIERHYRKLLPLMPLAIERLALDRYDVVISTSHAVAKGVRTVDPHLCYCFTPMRYVWDQADTYLGRGVRRAVATPLVAWLRRWDRRSSSEERVSRFLGISTTVVERIKRHYGRDAGLIHPPVRTDEITPLGAPSDDYYLLVGGFVPYKREELALEAFGRLGWPLVVAGDGPTRARLAETAPANVHFTGRVSDAELVRLYQGCRALVYPQEEDFGIIAVEAQAAGRPVVAFGGGGAIDTVVPIDDPQGRAATGVWFREPTPDALVDALVHFDRVRGDFDSKEIRAHAERFSPARFRAGISAELNRLVG